MSDEDITVTRGGSAAPEGTTTHHSGARQQRTRHTFHHICDGAALVPVHALSEVFVVANTNALLSSEFMTVAAYIFQRAIALRIKLLSGSWPDFEHTQTPDKKTNETSNRPKQALTSKDAREYAERFDARVTLHQSAAL